HAGEYRFRGLTVCLGSFQLPLRIRFQLNQPFRAVRLRCRRIQARTSFDFRLGEAATLGINTTVFDVDLCGFSRRGCLQNSCKKLAASYALSDLWKSARINDSTNRWSDQCAV